MATLTSQKIDELGTGAITFTTMTGGASGDEFINTGKDFIMLKGHATVAATVTFIVTITNVRHPNYGNTSKSNVVIALAATATHLVGPFKLNAFNDSDSKVKITTVMASGTAFPTAKVFYLDER